MAKKLQTLRGFQDFIGDAGEKIHRLSEIIYAISDQFGFQPAFTPILEDTNLFVRAIGDGTDIVNKELFTFNYSDQNICLRPENTASIVRAMINAGNYKSRICYFGPNFRKERPQKGRYRQFFQFGCEIIGEPTIAAEIDCLEFVITLINRLNINCKLKINSIGKLEDRKKYEQVIQEYLSSYYHELSDISKKQYDDKRFMRILDSKDTKDMDILKHLPIIDDYLSTESQLNMQNIIKYMNLKNILYEIDYKLVRGLDYYNDFVFELTDYNDNKAILGGGRYDGLFNHMGAQNTPAVGFAIGIERLIELYEDKTPQRKKIIIGLLCKNFDIYKYIDKLRDKFQIITKCDSISNLLRFANKNDIDWIIIIGDELEKNNTILIKNIKTSRQEQVLVTNIVNYFNAC